MGHQEPSTSPRLVGGPGLGAIYEIQPLSPPREVRWKDLRYRTAVGVRALEVAVFVPRATEAYLHKPCVVLLHRATRTAIWVVRGVRREHEIEIVASVADLAALDPGLHELEADLTKKFELWRKDLLKRADNGRRSSATELRARHWCTLPLHGGEGKVAEVRGTSIYLEGGSMETRAMLESILHALPFIPQASRRASDWKDALIRVERVTASLSLIESLSQGQGVFPDALMKQCDVFLDKETWTQPDLEYICSWCAGVSEECRRLEKLLGAGMVAGSSYIWGLLGGLIRDCANHASETYKIAALCRRSAESIFNEDPTDAPVLGKVVLLGSLALLCACMGQVAYFHLDGEEIEHTRSTLISRLATQVRDLLEEFD